MTITEYRCPECGSGDKLDIVATVFIRILHDPHSGEMLGTSPDYADNQSHEYSDESLAHCVACGHVTFLSLFNNPDYED